MIRLLRNTTVVFILLSIFIHLSVVLVLTLKRMEKPPETTRIEVEFKAPDELTPAPNDKKALKRQKVQASHEQVVEQQKQLNEEADKDSRFLSAFNQKVVKQTRAENSGKFNNTAKGSKKTEGSKTGDKTKKIAEKELPKEDPGELPELKDLTPKFSMDPGPQGNPSDENGNPSATDDYLKDVQSGLQTLLSTREFVYYSYYNRIKEALRQHWEPDVREKVKIIYRQGRTIASAKDRVTQVLVVLDSKGELIKVEILTQSGVIELDNAAVQAFREAAPFPNPPKGMIESDGTVKIRWDFVLEA
jgi:TonB family protein